MKPLIVFWPDLTGMIPGWSSTKVVQTVLVGCISRSWGQKIGFQNEIFINLLVWNYKAKSFHIWYIYMVYLVLFPWGQNWPRRGGHNFTLNYIRKTSNNFLSWTASVNLTKLNKNGRWVVPYQNCSNGPNYCISRSRVKKLVFKMQFPKTLSKTTRPRAFIFGIILHLINSSN